MKKIFLDTDILLDFLGDRKPFSKFALEIFLGAYHKNFDIYCSGNSITTAYYILGKLTTQNQSKALVLGLISQVNVIAVSDNILKSAFASDFNDVEDAVQFYSALTEKDIHCIITRNIKDYKKSTIPVFSSEEFILKNK